MSKPLVIGIGEVLWDFLPAGKQLGGAPANFAYHAYALGAETLVVSRVGNDPLGCELLSRLQSVGLRTDGITTDPSAPTGTVSVTLDGQGKPTFTIHENVAWDLIEAVKQSLGEASRADAVCSGILAQRRAIARAESWNRRIASWTMSALSPGQCHPYHCSCLTHDIKEFQLFASKK